jgi:toxin ParE1/3/4
MGYRLSADADRDIEGMLTDGIVAFGIDAAWEYRGRLFRTLDLLAANPRMGAARDGSRRKARVHPFGAHVILYRETRGGILILRVRPQRENWVRFVL